MGLSVCKQIHVGVPGHARELVAVDEIESEVPPGADVSHRSASMLR